MVGASVGAFVSEAMRLGQEDTQVADSKDYSEYIDYGASKLL